MITSGVRDISDNPLAAYRWLADGRKVGVSDANGAGFEYLGSLIYTRDGSDLDLESASFGGGRINKTSGGYETSYFITDHLGSVRATVNQNGALNSTNNYYPFGLRWNDPNALISTNRWLYSGKEMQITAFPETSGIFDFGWRMSDSRIGRWKNPDKLSEKYFPISPYAYCANNPIKNIDPDGNAFIRYWNHAKKTVTIRANYYYNGTSSEKSLNKAINTWNKKSGITYTHNGNTYNVKFKLKATRAANPSYAVDQDPMGNTYSVVGKIEGSKAIGNSDSKNIQVTEEHKYDTTGPHEVGHTLGMAVPKENGEDNHSKTGLMTKYLNDENHGEEVEQKKH